MNKNIVKIFNEVRSNFVSLYVPYPLADKRSVIAVNRLKPLAGMSHPLHVKKVKHAFKCINASRVFITEFQA